MSDLKTFNAAQVEGIKAMLASHMSWNEIGKCFGVNGETVRRAVDPVFRERRREQVAKRRSYASLGITPVTDAMCIDRRTVRQDAQARMAEIPDDTRGLTARICGDPLPGRSALDQMRSPE